MNRQGYMPAVAVLMAVLVSGGCVTTSKEGKAAPGATKQVPVPTENSVLTLLVTGGGKSQEYIHTFAGREFTVQFDNGIVGLDGRLTQVGKDRMFLRYKLCHSEPGEQVDGKTQYVKNFIGGGIVLEKDKPVLLIREAAKAWHLKLTWTP